MQLESKLYFAMIYIYIFILIYNRAEITLGKVLKKKKWRRSSYIVSTKLFWGGKAETEKGLSRKHVIEGLRASLERLQLDYVDIVFANKPDTSVPMEGR